MAGDKIKPGKGRHAAPAPDKRGKKAKPARKHEAAPKDAAKPRATRRVAKVVACLVLACAVVYGAGVAVFSFVFMPNTTLDGADVSWRPASSTSSDYASRVSSFTTKVAGEGLSFTLSGSDIELAFNEHAYDRSTIGQQDPWLWPLTITQVHEIVSKDGVTFSEEKLSNCVTTKVEEFNKAAIEPENSTIAFDEKTQQYAVTKPVYGTAIDAEAFVAEIAAAIGELPEKIEPSEESLKRPELTEDSKELAKAAEDANRFLKAVIPLTLAGNDAGEVTREQISQWIVLADDLTASLDGDKLAAWVKTEIAGAYDTAGCERTYTRPDGKAVTVKGGSYGWITDESALIDTLTQAIENGSTDAVAIPTRQEAGAVPDSGKRDWPARYIDVDLSEQKVRMYGDDGSLAWEASCVTGNHADGNDTPCGVYQINRNKQRGQRLQGPKDPETGEYKWDSWVDYWMPFIGNTYGLHDASWRGAFGGKTYLTNGSHGCINLPPAKAQTLYDLCQVGDVVVVHY